MATSFPYAFQPQPPSHPKTNAGKRGPSLPIAILSPSDDSESDVSISDFSPPSNTRPAATESSKITVPPLPSPRNHSTTNKKPSLPISLSPRLSTNTASNATITTTTSIVTTNQVSSGNLTSNSLPAASSNLHNTATTNTNNIGIQPLPGANSHNASGSFTAASPSSSLSGSSSTSSSLPSAISLPTPAASGTKTLPPAITIPPQTAAALTTGIPALSNSALSPTASSQNSNTNTNSSSHDSHKENDSPSSSPRNRSCSPSSNFAYEHDHDYENVASPCSSTASGPTYIRPAGFQHHAQEFIAKTKPKKKKTSATLVTLRDGYKKREPTPPKLKPKREPLPMKLRALPQSFWQQPNVTNQVSPASNFPILPPLCHKDTEEAMGDNAAAVNEVLSGSASDMVVKSIIDPLTHVSNNDLFDWLSITFVFVSWSRSTDERPVTPPEDREAGLKHPERKITVTNSDLLFKLFDGIGEEKKGSQSRSKQNSRHKKPVAKSNTGFLFNGNDPYLMEDVTEKIFPQLNLEGRKPNTGGGNACLQLITLKEGDRDVMFPSLSTEQNYPQLLSELVMHI